MTPKQIDNQINNAWRIHGDRLQIPLMDIQRIFQAARLAHANGEAVDSAVKRIADTYRSNSNGHKRRIGEVPQSL